MTNIDLKDILIIMNTTRLDRIKRISLLALMLALTVIFCFVPIQFGAITLALMILPTLIISQTCSFSTSAFMALMMGIINYIAWFTTKAPSPVAPIFQNPLVCILPRLMIGITAYACRKGLERLLFPPCGSVIKIKDEYHRELDLNAPIICWDEKNASTSDIIEPDNIVEFDANILDKSASSHRPHNRRTKKAKDILKYELIYALSTAVGVVTNTLFVAIFTLLFFNNTSIAANTVVTVEYVLAWFGLNFAIEVVSFSLITPPIVLALKASKLVK